MRTIAIILDDNDFGQTFEHLLESIHRAITWQGRSLEREAVERMIRAGIEFHYVAFQSARHLSDLDASSIRRTMDHLGKISVLFDEEAEADIAAKDHDHGAWYLEVPTGNIFSY